MPTALPRLRKREIAFAVAMGVMGAGGAALILDGDEPQSPTAGRDLAREDKVYLLDGFDGIANEGPQDVREQADVAISGSGDVEISGPGVCSVESEGSGEVRCESSEGEAG